MKNIILSILLFCSVSLYSKESKERLVLDKFELGLDDFNSIKNKIKTNELNIWQYENQDIIKLTYNNYYYKLGYCKLGYCKLVLLLVDNKLYGVRYSTLNDRSYDKYIKYLNKEYNICSRNGDSDFWFNSDIEIYYELIPKGEWLDSFVHYDSELLKKYPQYKNF